MNWVQTTRRCFVASLAASKVLFSMSWSESGETLIQALTGFNREGQSALDEALKDPSFRGRIPASLVKSLMRVESISRDALMMKLLPISKSLAHPPLSNFFVGAVASGHSGNLYLGANIEIPNNILGLTVHAEQAAIANAYMSDENGIDAIAVTAAPCGHCRQFLSELSLESSMRVLVMNSSEVELADLLPRAFGPKDLGLQQGALPVHQHRMSLLSDSRDSQVLAALAAASSSYSPYTQSPSGVALSTSSGRTYKGSYIENAAFNPSLPPLEVALAGFYAAGKSAGDIVRLVLVEGQGNKIRQEGAAQAALLSLASAARFDVFQARVDPGPEP